MIPYKDIKEIYNDIIQDRIMKVVLRIIMILLLVMLVIEATWYNIDRYKGKHVKMIYGLFEANIKNDTIIKYKTDTIYKKGTKINSNKIGKVGTLNQY